MRITGGLARGRRLAAPKTETRFLRPTCDRVREALFNILGARVEGALALDLFAGTGAWGVEALSRGAKALVFVDESPEAARLIVHNIGNCLPGANAVFIRRHLDGASKLDFLAAKLPAPHCFNLVFMDPPYQKGLAEQLLGAVARAGILAPDALVIAEERRQVELPERIGALTFTDRRQYGESALWFFNVSSEQRKNKP